MRNPLKNGFFPGGDPRLFTPDQDGQSPEEAEAHRAACAAWDAGATNSTPDCSHVPGAVITRCQFGLGSYTYDDEIWIWDYVRWVWLDAVRSRIWWWWHLDARNWAARRGLLAWRLVRRAFDEET